jgi:hypothetical protein
MQYIKKQLWGRKYTHTLGQSFHLAPNLKECVISKSSHVKIIKVLKSNPMVLSITIDHPHGSHSWVEVGKNIVEFFLLDGGFGVNIVIEGLVKN